MLLSVIIVSVTGVFIGVLSSFIYEGDEQNAILNLFGADYDNQDMALVHQNLYEAMYDYFVGSGPGAAEDMYAPDVLIIGALIVADPNNLDGSGSYNSNAGNIDIDIVSLIPDDEGSFTITHSRNYEKLLTSPEIKSKIIVNTWEEL